MVTYGSLIGEIRKRLDVLEDEVAGLRAENGQLRAENAQLQAENVRLQEEKSELRHRLGQNGDNSHKPPSSDGSRKKRVQPDLPREGKRRSLTAQQDAVLAFALVAGVPFTNKQAERDLRPAKVKLKYARLQALMATCRKQQRHVFLTLRQRFVHQPVSLLAGG